MREQPKVRDPKDKMQTNGTGQARVEENRQEIKNGRKPAGKMISTNSKSICAGMALGRTVRKSLGKPKSSKGF